MRTVADFAAIAEEEDIGLCFFSWQGCDMECYEHGDYPPPWSNGHYEDCAINLKLEGGPTNAI